MGGLVDGVAAMEREQKSRLCRKREFPEAISFKNNPGQYDDPFFLSLVFSLVSLLILHLSSPGPFFS
jgi:hypothetical protein